MSENKTSKTYVRTSLVQDHVTEFSLFPKTFDLEAGSSREIIPKSVDLPSYLSQR